MHKYPGYTGHVSWGNPEREVLSQPFSKAWRLLYAAFPKSTPSWLLSVDTELTTLCGSSRNQENSPAPSDSLVLANPELSGSDLQSHGHRWHQSSSQGTWFQCRTMHTFGAPALGRISWITWARSRGLSMSGQTSCPSHWCHPSRRWQTPKLVLPGPSASHAGRSLVRLTAQTASARNEIGQ